MRNDDAARFLLRDALAELAWRIETHAVIIQNQLSVEDEFGALRSMSLLAENWRLMADTGRKLRAIRDRREASDKAQSEAIKEVKAEALA
jgi:hypothetical protein